MASRSSLVRLAGLMGCKCATAAGTCPGRVFKAACAAGPKAMSINTHHHWMICFISARDNMPQPARIANKSCAPVGHRLSRVFFHAKKFNHGEYAQIVDWVWKET